MDLASLAIFAAFAAFALLPSIAKLMVQFSTSAQDMADSEAVSAPRDCSRAAERPPEIELPQASGLPSEVPELYPPPQAYLKVGASSHCGVLCLHIL